jgi:hypothetical protein
MVQTVKVLPTTTTTTGTAEHVSYDDFKKTTLSDRDHPLTEVEHVGDECPWREYKPDHDLAKAHVATAQYISDNSPETKGMVKSNKCSVINEDGNNWISRHRGI